MGEISTSRIITHAVATVFNVIIIVTDRGSPMLSTSVTFDITVTETNNNKPIFGNLPGNVAVNDIVIQDFNVTDADDGEAGTVGVELEQLGNVFNLIGNSIFLNQEVDYEERNTYEVTLVAIDNGDPAQTTSVTVQININDINEFAPRFSQSLYNASALALDGTQPGGVYTSVVSATDADGFYNTFTYSIDNDYDGVFTMDSINRELRRTTNESISAPDAGLYNFTVVAEDNGIDMRRSGTSQITLSLVYNTNHHSPMLDMEQYIVNIPEDTNLGDIILTVTATDGDDPNSPAGQITSFTLTGSDGMYFRIIHNDTENFIGHLILNTTLDYGSYEVIITATDKGLGSRHSTPAGLVIINVMDVNDNFPIFDPAEYTASVEENTIPTQPLLTVTATDADSAATGFGNVTYSIENTDSSFTINNMGEISVNMTLDREILETFALSVVATDGGGLMGYANVTITVDDVNDNTPVFSIAEYSFTVIEEEMGALVGSVFATDTDHLQNGAVRYLFEQSAAADYFIINQTSGTITTTQAIDREQISSLTFNVIAEDHGLQPMSSSVTVVVMISDINDNAPRFVTPLSGTEFRISENVSAVFNITNTRFHAVDDDVNNNIIYRIVGGTGLGIFGIYPTGYIHLANGTLDRETTSFYNLTVEARDDGNMSTEITGTIRILDVNDRLPEFTLNQYAAFVFEDISVGTMITTVSAIDFDEATDNHTVGYGFVPNDMCNSPTDYNNVITEDGVDFAINSITGSITLNSGMLDADIVMPNITLCVVAYSSADPTFVTDYAPVIIIPMDVNEHDPVFDTGCTSFTIDETVTVGAVIYTIVGSDVDQDSDLHYQISDSANSLQIHNSGSIYLENPLDLESITFTCGTLKCILYIVTLFDHPNTSLPTTRSTFCSGFISVRDVDNNAPSFGSSVYYGAVYENANVGDVVKVLQDGRVGTADLDVTATDVDVGYILRYSLVNDSFTTFEFDSEINGILQVGEMLDYETVTEYTFDIIVRDTGGQNDTATVNIMMVRINRNQPIFEQVTYNFSVTEELNVGLTIGTVSASDYDSSQNQILYKIESSFPNGSFFSINNQTGEISINSVLDSEQYSEYELVVVAVDQGSPPLTASTIVSIAITDIRTNHTTAFFPYDQPQFEHCISYNNGQPALQLLSYVIVDASRMSLSLTFSASYQTGNSTNSQSTTCSLLSNMQYNCTAEFAVDIISSVKVIESVNVTVSGPFGSNSSASSLNAAVRVILDVTTIVLSTSATLDCTLPCFSPNLHCHLTSITTSSGDISVINNVTSAIVGSVMSYSNPTQQIFINNLLVNTTYEYCVVAVDMTNLIDVGEPVCGSFRTQNISVLQRCTITSPYTNTIEVSCELLETYNRISVTIFSNSCTCSPPVTVIGDNPIIIFNLTAEVYTVEVTAVSMNDVIIENKRITEMIMVYNKSSPSIESDSDSLSIGAAVAITCVLTLLVSVITTAIVSSAITYTLTKSRDENIPQGMNWSARKIQPMMEMT